MNHHRIRSAFKDGVDPATKDAEILPRYLAGANWKNKYYEGQKGKKGSEKRSKRPAIRYFPAPAEGWNKDNLGLSYRS